MKLAAVSESNQIANLAIAGLLDKTGKGESIRRHRRNPSNAGALFGSLRHTAIPSPPQTSSDATVPSRVTFDSHLPQRAPSTTTTLQLRSADVPPPAEAGTAEAGTAEDLLPAPLDVLMGALLIMLLILGRYFLMDMKTAVPDVFHDDS
ncbi:MAG: uncharacterized protein KVP18_004738 [Porospora cf. gigantea A]|uniref:uncharacterized protein n=1 Tax=Porospora cf. gigantea A TaxID=2853593 RepID=UPI003559734F|nr:MAG: hypothetical protein KVP18_004738 [Porospora cf. gigantea A]